MFDINEVRMTGRHGNDAEFREVSINNSTSIVANMRIARSRTSKGAKVTDWFSVVYWPKTERETEFLKEQLRKGMGVFVQGELRTRSYVDSEGREREVTEIHAFDIQPDLQPKAAEPPRQSEPAPTPAATPAQEPEPALPQRQAASANGSPAPRAAVIF
jgi:single-strand DNA-binding protein